MLLVSLSEATLTITRYIPDLSCVNKLFHHGVEPFPGQAGGGQLLLQCVGLLGLTRGVNDALAVHQMAQKT